MKDWIVGQKSDAFLSTIPPANHSFCAKSLEGKYLLVYNTDESKIESTRKKYFYQDLLTSAINKMDNLYTNNKTKLNKDKQKKI